VKTGKSIAAAFARWLEGCGSRMLLFGDFSPGFNAAKVMI